VGLNVFQTFPFHPQQLPVYLAVALACFLTGLSKAGFGGALGFLVTPMLALVMPLNQAVGLMLPILILGDVFTLSVYWRRWEVRHLWILFAGALIGVTLATLVLANFPLDALRKGLGVLVLVFVAYRLLERRILNIRTYQTRSWHGVLAGSLAGFTSTLAHAGGPLIAIYLLLQQLPPATFIATSTLFFVVLNWIKVPYYYFAGLFDFEYELQFIWLLPLLPLGVWTGRRLVNRMNKKVFETVIIGLLLASGLLLLFR
jgi:uncharacterized membrane protein YfcA